MRKETLHLYDNAFEIIAGGLRLDHRPYRSERPSGGGRRQLRERIRSIDIDEQYNLNVKSLYGEIVAYISRAQATMTPAQIDDLFALRAAGKDVVEAIKDTKHLQKNLDLYLRLQQSRHRRGVQRRSGSNSPPSLRGLERCPRARRRLGRGPVAGRVEGGDERH